MRRGSETEEEENVDTQRERARGSKTQEQTISCKSFLTTILVALITLKALSLPRTLCARVDVCVHM